MEKAEKQYLYSAIAHMASYCSRYDECKSCEMYPLCASMHGGVIKFEYVFNRVNDRLKANLLS